jgi:TatD DNase family protein
VAGARTRETRPDDRPTVLFDPIDTHCHLEMLDDADAALVAARAAGVEGVIAVGMDAASSRRAVDYAQRNRDVYATVGVHPHEARLLDDTMLGKLQRLAHSEKVVAIGECGLDYYRDRSPRETQRSVFINQIGLARRLELPLIVHVREAGEEAMEILAEFAEGITVVMHCFSLTGQVEECNARGYYMSFAGNLTYKNAGDLRAAAALVRDELLLVETDAPFLTPEPHRSKDNQPAWIVHTVERLAEVRGWKVERAADVTTANARRAFLLDRH